MPSTNSGDWKRSNLWDEKQTFMARAARSSARSAAVRALNWNGSFRDTVLWLIASREERARDGDLLDWTKLEGVPRGFLRFHLPESQARGQRRRRANSTQFPAPETHVAFVMPLQI
jgi:hypothetical protein